MKATAAVVVTNRAAARFRYSHYETVSSSSGSCPMCSAPIEAHVPHACAKPDLDEPPHTVRPRCAPFESATFPFLVHRGMRVRFEGRVYRYTNYEPLVDGRARDADFVESRAQFYALVEVGVLEEVTHAIA